MTQFILKHIRSFHKVREAFEVANVLLIDGVSKSVGLCSSTD